VISTEGFEELLARLRPRNIVSIAAHRSFWAICQRSFDESSTEPTSSDNGTFLSAVGIIIFEMRFEDGTNQSVPVRFTTVRALEDSAAYEYRGFVIYSQEYCEELSAQLRLSVTMSAAPELCGVTGGKNIDWFFAVDEL
jgi:hypothetical protein